MLAQFWIRQCDMFFFCPSYSLSTTPGFGVAGAAGAGVRYMGVFWGGSSSTGGVRSNGGESGGAVHAGSRWLCRFYSCCQLAVWLPFCSQWSEERLRAGADLSLPTDHWSVYTTGAKWSGKGKLTEHKASWTMIPHIIKTDGVANGLLATMILYQCMFLTIAVLLKRMSCFGMYK